MRNVTYFTLSAYVNTGPLKYLYFTVLLLMYLVILAANVLLITVICLNRSLHEPMYVFLCSLFLNELYGSTGLLPFLLLQILEDVHTVSYWFCFIQIFCLYTYGNIEFLLLAVMSYDRYSAICFPLQYNTHMNTRKVFLLIALSWFYPFLSIGITVALAAPLKLCGNVINKVYCDNFFIVRLSCSDTRVNNIYGLVATALIIFVPVITIFYTYMRILRVCFSGSKQTRQKALSTCAPHIASLLNFSFGCFFEILQSRFNMSALPNIIRIILSLYFLTCQPLFNPLMYGLKLTKIQLMCKKLVLDSTVNMGQNFVTSWTKK